MTDEGQVFPNPEELFRMVECEDARLQELIMDSQLLTTAEVGPESFDMWLHPSGALIIYPTQGGLLDLLRKADKELS